MWFSERYTFKRGRSEVPMTFLRIRSCTCRRFAFLDNCVSILFVLGRWSLAVGQSLELRLLAFSRIAMSLADDERPTTVLFRSRLTDLLLQAFAGVTHTLIFVRIRRTQAAHFGSNLSNLLTINAGDGQFGLLRVNCRFNTGRQRIFNGMRISQAEYNCALALELGAITDADDFQFARPAFGYAFHGVIHQGASQPMDSPLGVVLANRHQIPVLLFHANAARKRSIELALRPLYGDNIAFDFYCHSLGERDRLS